MHTSIPNIKSNSLSTSCFRSSLCDVCNLVVQTPSTPAQPVVLQAVQYIEAMVGKTEACAQYDRLVTAVKGRSSCKPVRRVMPAIHSY